MEIIANQDRESERSDCDEKDDDLFESIAELHSKLSKLYNKPTPPVTIMLIGKSGAGKSALINTLLKGITGYFWPMHQQEWEREPLRVAVTGGIFGESSFINMACRTREANTSTSMESFLTSRAMACTVAGAAMAGGVTGAAEACISSPTFNWNRKYSSPKSYIIIRGFRMKEIFTLSDGLTDDLRTFAPEAPKISNEQLLDGPSNSNVSVVSMKHVDQSEAEKFINYSSKPERHSGSSEGDDAIYPVNDRVLCKVCYMNELRIVFLPCSHMVACRRCAARLKSCPVCRSGINEALPANLHE